MAIFSCSCGFTYTRKGPDKTVADLYRYDRIRELGHICNAKIKELLLIKGQSVRKIVEELKVPRKMITQNILESNYELRNLFRLQKDLDEKINIRREYFLETLERNPGLTRSQLFKINPNDYTWLLKYDKNWLENHLPPSKKRH